MHESTLTISGNIFRKAIMRSSVVGEAFLPFSLVRFVASVEIIRNAGDVLVASVIWRNGLSVMVFNPIENLCPEDWNKDE